MQTVVSLVAGGLGVALVPTVSSRQGPKQVVFRAVSDMPASAAIGIALAYRADNSSPVLQRFREAAASRTAPDGVRSAAHHAHPIARSSSGAAGV